MPEYLLFIDSKQIIECDAYMVFGQNEKFEINNKNYVFFWSTDI